MNERWAEFKVRYHAMQDAMQAEVEALGIVCEKLKKENEYLKEQIESIQGIVGCKCEG